MKEKTIVLIIKGKEIELNLSDFPIPVKIKDKKSGKYYDSEQRTLDARINPKDKLIKIRCN